MDYLEQFCTLVDREQTLLLATSAHDTVTMRMVSPILFGHDILIFTHAQSTKYAQLKINPKCALSIGTFFACAEAHFQGGTLLAQNQPLRAAYCMKYPDAFDEGVAFGGRDAEFIVFNITHLSGWLHTSENPEPGAIPTQPFAVDL